MIYVCSCRIWEFGYSHVSRCDRDDAAQTLCILDRDRRALLDPTKWPAYITVSEWYFKDNTVRMSVSDDQQRSSAAASTVPPTVVASVDTERDQAHRV